MTSRIASQISPLPHVGERAWVRGNLNPGNCYVPPLTPLRRSATLKNEALPEIVWVLGRTSVVPKGVPYFVRRGVGR